MIRPDSILGQLILGPQKVAEIEAPPERPSQVSQEEEFQSGIRQTEWFKEFVQKFGEEPDLDTKDYDYRKAWAAGARPDVRDPKDGLYHWPSEFKGDNHPNRFVDGVDTKTGRKYPTDISDMSRKDNPYITGTPKDVGGGGFRTNTQKVTILETPTGWLNKHTGQTYKSAVQAQRAMDADQKRLMQNKDMVVYEVTWEPTTPTGTIVVRGLTGSATKTDKQRSGFESLRGITELTTDMAPKGLGLEKARKSDQIEDTRQEWADDLDTLIATKGSKKSVDRFVSRHGVRGLAEAISQIVDGGAKVPADLMTNFKKVMGEGGIEAIIDSQHGLDPTRKADLDKAWLQWKKRISQMPRTTNNPMSRSAGYNDMKVDKIEDIKTLRK